MSKFEPWQWSQTCNAFAPMATKKSKSSFEKKTWQSTFKFSFWSWKQGCPGVSATQCLFACLTNPRCHICNNHLRNVWFGEIEKSLTKELNKILQSSLDKIDSTLCVTLSTSAIIRAIDKELSLLANYPKVHGELFLEWTQEIYSDTLLFHSTIGEQSLLSSNWNKGDKEGA